MKRKIQFQTKNYILLLLGTIVIFMAIVFGWFLIINKPNFIPQQITNKTKDLKIKMNKLYLTKDDINMHFIFEKEKSSTSILTTKKLENLKQQLSETNSFFSHGRKKYADATIFARYFQNLVSKDADNTKENKEKIYKCDADFIKENLTFHLDEFFLDKEKENALTDENFNPPCTIFIAFKMRDKESECLPLNIQIN